MRTESVSHLEPTSITPSTAPKPTTRLQRQQSWSIPTRPRWLALLSSSRKCWCYPVTTLTSRSYYRKVFTSFHQIDHCKWTTVRGCPSRVLFFGINDFHTHTYYSRGWFQKYFWISHWSRRRELPRFLKVVQSQPLVWVPVNVISKIWWLAIREPRALKR